MRESRFLGARECMVSVKIFHDYANRKRDKRDRRDSKNKGVSSMVAAPLFILTIYRFHSLPITRILSNMVVNHALVTGF